MKKEATVTMSLEEYNDLYNKSQIFDKVFKAYVKTYEGDTYIETSVGVDIDLSAIKEELFELIEQRRFDYPQELVLEMSSYNSVLSARISDFTVYNEAEVRRQEEERQARIKARAERE